MTASATTTSFARPRTATSCIRGRSRSTTATDADRKIVVFYGGNDGVLRAVNGNRDTSIGR